MTRFAPLAALLTTVAFADEPDPDLFPEMMPVNAVFQCTLYDVTMDGECEAACPDIDWFDCLPQMGPAVSDSYCPECETTWVFDECTVGDLYGDGYCDPQCVSPDPDCM